MKKILFPLCCGIILTACEKGKMHCQKESQCETIKTEEIPCKIKEAFTTKYATIKAEKWYEMNDDSYSAVFSKCNEKYMARFGEGGCFKEEKSLVQYEEEVKHNKTMGCSLSETDPK